MYRTGARGNPVSTLIARFFGMAVGRHRRATATAEASPANAMTCVKPFTIPDRWIETQTPPWDPNDTFDMFDNKGKPLANPDVYVPATDAGYTGYDAERDKGMQVTLKADNGSKHRAQLLLGAGDARRHRRRRLPLEHRQLQHRRSCASAML